MAARQNPTDKNNLTQWSLYETAPKERRMNVVSEYVTIYGEAPSGAHEAEPVWKIWRESKDENGRITVEFAQDGANNLYWIYNSVSFDPVVDLSGNPYFIQLDNDIVYDGMGAGLPVANISVLDVDDITHDIEVVHDPYNKFTVVGNVLVLTDTVQLIDIAYPLRLRATDDEGNSYDQVFAIYVQDTTPPVAGDFVGELNLFEEDATVAASNTVTLIDYTLPANRELRFRIAEAFGDNIGAFEVQIDGVRVALKKTYYTYYETDFAFENFTVESGQNIKILATNRGSNAAYFNARIRGYQYAV